MQNIIDTLATIAARIEALAHPDAVILPFPRSIQLDTYSCGAHAVYAILKYFRKRCTYANIEKQLHTDEDGTDVSDIKRVFKRYDLKCRRLRNLKTAINNGHPVLVTLYDSEHYAVIYGYSATHIWIMNSSLDFTEDGVGSLGCAVRKDRFREIWDKWGLVISTK